MSRPKFPVLLLGTLTALLLTTACGSIDRGDRWDRGYRLRFWQKFKLDGETDFVRGRYASARDLWQEAVRQAEAMGQDNFRIGISLYDVALAQSMLQQPQDAISSLQRARTIFEHQLQTKLSASQKVEMTHELANTWALLGQMQAAVEDREAAERSFAQANQLYGSLSDRYDSDPVLRREHAESMASLAMLDLSMDKRQDAERYFQEAMPLAEASFSSPTALDNLKRGYASLMKVTARDDEAQKMVPDDPRLAELLKQVDEAADDNDWGRQTQAAQEALRVARTSNFPELTEAQTLTSLILPFAARGHYGQAEEYANRATQLRKQVRAQHDGLADHLEAVTVRAYIESQQYAKAMPILLEQIVWRENNLSDQKLRVTETAADLAQCYARLGETQKAAPLIQRCLQALEKRKNAKGRRQYVLARVADAYMAGGDYARAMPLLQELQSLPIGKRGDKQFRQAERFMLLADCEKGLKQYAQANGHYQQAFNILQSANRTVAGACCARWADLKHRQNDDAGADQLYARALKLLDNKDQDAQQQIIERIIPDYCTVLQALGKDDQCEQIKASASR